MKSRTKTASCLESRIVQVLVVGLWALFLSIACSGCAVGKAKPPHMGVFIKEGSKFIEISMQRGGSMPASNQVARCKDSDPTIVIWNDEISLDLLQVKLRDTGQEIAYDAVSNKDDIVTLSFRDDLQPGTYYVRQGNWMTPEKNIPYWWFLVGDGEVTPSDQAKKVKAPSSADMRVVPPGDGLFLVVDGSAVALHDDMDDLSEMPATENLRPVLLLMSDVYSPDKVKFSYPLAGIGVMLSPFDSQCTIMMVEADSGAAVAGLVEGDVVLSIDGQAVGSSQQCDELSQGTFMSTVEYEVLRGTKRVAVTITRNVPVGQEEVSASYTMLSDYARFQFDSVLPPGLCVCSYEAGFDETLLGVFWVGDRPLPLPTPTLEPSPTPRATIEVETVVLTLAPGIDLELVRVPAGPFIMGSAEGDSMADSEESPQHTVELSEYYIGKYEVTVEQYRVFVEATGHEGDKDALGGSGDHPVNYVSWDDAVAFCWWASEETGMEVRLPTEAEWEKAARGTGGDRYPWGNDSPDTGKCNYDGNVGGTTPVGEYSPQGTSPYGCADMAGNVWEWTSSLYKDYPYKSGDGREDQDDHGARVFRGGSFNYDARIVRSAYRVRYDPNARNYLVGFRVCASPIS